MPWGMAGLTVLVAPAIAHVLGSRVRPIIALPFAAFLILLLVVPVNTGERITDLSFAMFYNRVGWATLAALLVMHLRPANRRKRQGLLDALSAALLVLVMLYTKVSYGAVGVGFLALLLLDKEQRGWVIGAFGIMAAAALVIEAFWGGTSAYIADIRLAGNVSGNVKGVRDLGVFLLRNLADLTLFLLIAGLALRRTRSLRDLLFYGFCIAAGVLLISQNFQSWGMITLHAGAVVGAETLVRGRRSQTTAARGWSIPQAAPLLVLALVLPASVQSAAALGLHTTLASLHAGEALGLPKLNEVRLAKLKAGGDYAFNSGYLQTLREGARILAELQPEPSHVFVMDFVTPFSAGLGLKPPRGDTAWLHWGRTLDVAHHIAPDEIFRDVRLVMEPKRPAEGWTAGNLRQIYGSYLHAHFGLVRDTPEWRVYEARNWRPRSTAVAEAKRPGSGGASRTNTEPWRRRLEASLPDNF